MDTFFKNLRRLRTAKHMTQEQASQALDQQALNYETTRDTNITAAKQLAN